jgi:hypothetical protein
MCFLNVGLTLFNEISLKILGRKSKGKGSLRELGMDEKIIFNCILKKQDMRV